MNKVLEREVCKVSCPLYRWTDRQSVASYGSSDKGREYTTQYLSRGKVEVLEMLLLLTKPRETVGARVPFIYRHNTRQVNDLSSQAGKITLAALTADATGSTFVLVDR